MSAAPSIPMRGNGSLSVKFVQGNLDPGITGIFREMDPRGQFGVGILVDPVKEAITQNGRRIRHTCF
jgi:hypothetical protein